MRPLIHGLFIFPFVCVILTDGSLTCALSKVLHGDILVLPAGDGPQLALVGVGHPIRAAHLLRGHGKKKRRWMDGWTDAYITVIKSLWQPRVRGSHLGLVPLVAVGGRALAVGLAAHLDAGGAEAALQLVARGRSLWTCAGEETVVERHRKKLSHT